MNEVVTKLAVGKLLKILADGVVIGTGLVAPNAIKALKPLLNTRTDTEVEYKRLLRHMRRLQLIDVENLADGKTYISLTQKGQKRLNQAELEDVKIEKPNKWDGKWRIVTYDIPGTKRHERYEFISQLHRLGFDKLLQSMWVYPFACEQEVNQIAAQLGLTKNIVYLESRVDATHHKELLKFFARELKNNEIKNDKN